MKMKCLAFALCGMAPVLAAQAQSSVTLYGIIDNGLIADKTESRNSVNAINSSLSVANRWGIRGVEELGNGLKAKFVLESGMAADTGEVAFGRLFGRAAYVALESRSLGELQLGRMANLGLLYTAGVMSPFGPSFQRASVTTTAAYNTGDFGALARVNNAAYYFSPVFAGLQAAVGYSFNAASTEVAGQSNNERLVDAGLRFNRGPLRAAVSYQYVLPSALTPTDGKPSNLQIGASYDFGVVTVSAGYGRLNNPRVDPGATGVTNFAATHDSDNAYMIGATVPVGNGRVLAGYQKATGSKIEGYGLAYVYDLSKRTWVYLYANRTETRFFTLTGATANDQWRRQVAAGVAHRF